MVAALFDDKARNYAKPSLRAETTYSFYDRSSLEEFARCRLMLQRWVDRLPPAKQKDIVARIRHKGRGSWREEQSFNGAFFELFLHEFLNGTGGDTVAEPKIGHLTPDFGVTEARPDGTQINYVVEATDLNIMHGTGLDSHWNERHALDILDEIISPDFSLSVETAGILATTPRQRDLKRPFEELVRTANYDAVWAEVELHGYLDRILPEATFQHDGWRVTGQLIPAPPGASSSQRSLHKHWPRESRQPGRHRKVQAQTIRQGEAVQGRGQPNNCHQIRRLARPDWRGTVRQNGIRDYRVPGSDLRRTLAAAAQCAETGRVLVQY